MEPINISFNLETQGRYNWFTKDAVKQESLGASGISVKKQSSGLRYYYNDY